jgi:acyl-coenzyme A thioesterase PaaI-like protein
MARICKTFGKLLVIDFHEEGFKVLEKAYRESHGEEHKRNFITYESIHNHLETCFEEVRMFHLPLNTVWVASGKVNPIRQNIPSHSKCFACGHKNSVGFNLQFQKSGENRITADLVINSDYGGYPGIVQGGAAATILDSAMANCLYICEGIQGVTAKLEVRYIKPLELNIPINIESKILNSKICMYEIESVIKQENTTKVSAKGLFFPYKAK